VQERGSSEPGGSLLGPRIVALTLIVGGVFLVYDALQIHSGQGYSVVGPATAPLFVSAGLIVLGILLGIRTTISPDLDLARHVAEEAAVTHWRSVALLVGLLVIYAVALNGVRLGSLEVPGVGYIPATTLFLPAAARVLGSSQPVRDLGIGLTLAVVIYVGFTQFLGVRLPPGLLG
jgi:putative tricarboxylic transport membrane protein